MQVQGRVAGCQHLAIRQFTILKLEHDFSVQCYVKLY
jgi:hypothetical protein